MVDNFDTFPFEWVEGEFYFFQILNREKSRSNNKNRCIKSYFIRDQKHLDEKKQDMINIAEGTNSRIYMHPSRRNENKISLELISYVADCIKNNEVGRLWRSYETICGRNKGVENIWIIDIDTKDWSAVDECIVHINNLRPNRLQRHINPTVNGYHLLYRGGFDRSQYKLEHDIHTNNPTLLYYK